MWKKEVSTHSFDNQVNLVALQNRIAVTTSYQYGDYMADDQRRLTFFDPVTGDVVLQTEDLNEWPFTKPSGKAVIGKTGSDHSNGILLEINNELLFGETGFGVSLCSGKLAHTELKGHWKLSTRDPLVYGSSLMFFDSTSAITGAYDFFSLELQTKIAELKGYKTDSTIFKIAFAEGDIASISQPVTNGKSIFFIYVKNDNKLYLGEYSAKNGVKISETVLLPEKNYRGYWCSRDQLILSGNNLLIPAGTTLPEENPLYPPQDGHMIYDLTTKQIKSSSGKTFAFDQLHVMTGENLFVLRKNESGIFYIDQINLDAGTKVREIESDLLNSVDNGVEIASSMILHDQGYLIMKGGNPAASDDDFLIVQYTGDMSEGKRQYKYNNQGNPYIELITQTDSQSASEEEGTGAADEGADAVLSPADLSENTLPGSELIYKDLVNMDSLYSAYVPLLKRVSFNTDGEAGGVGEGALIVRGSISCPDEGNCCPGEFSSKLYYPYKIYLPLDDRKIVVENKESQPLLTFHPDIPIYYSLWESLENDEERKTMFSYQAYEHDTQDALDSLTGNFGDLLDLGIAIFTGDICGMVTSVLDMGEGALTPVDENYGSAFAYLTRNSGVQGSIFGVPKTVDSAVITIGASDEPDNMQTAVGLASDTADLVCSAIDIYGAVTDPEAYQNMAVSLTSFGPDVSGRATQGDLELNKKLLLPVSSLKITLDKVETDMQWPITNLYLRAGILGEDFPSTLLDNAANTDKTPFISYLKWSKSSESGFKENVDITLYEGKFNNQR
ncbi:MAG: hypothetical protein HQK62_09070, partial [Desulfamplus sp.]|nr:hypothetical protein [Desulfamplus sp.]